MILYAKNFDNTATIAPAGYMLVNPGDHVTYQYGFFNELDLLNTSGEQLQIRMNGSSTNIYTVLAGERLNIEKQHGQRYKWIFIYNMDAVNTVQIGELKINVRRSV